MKNIFLIVFLLFYGISECQENFNPYDQGVKEFFDSQIKKKYLNLDKVDTIYVSEMAIVTKDLSKTYFYNGRNIPLKVVSDKILKQGYIGQVLEINPISLKDNELFFSVSLLGVKINKNGQIELIITEGVFEIFKLKFNKKSERYYIEIGK